MGERGPRPRGPTVEQCTAFDADRAVRRRDRSAGRGVIVSGGRRVGYLARLDDPSGAFVGLGWGTCEADVVTQKVALRHVDLPVGGRRWWAVCHVCDRSQRILYLPPGQERFACRKCLGLAYASSRASGGRSDRADRELAREYGLKPREVRSLIRELLMFGESEVRGVRVELPGRRSGSRGAGS